MNEKTSCLGTVPCWMIQPPVATCQSVSASESVEVNKQIPNATIPSRKALSKSSPCGEHPFPTGWCEGPVISLLMTSEANISLPRCVHDYSSDDEFRQSDQPAATRMIQFEFGREVHPDQTYFVVKRRRQDQVDCYRARVDPVSRTCGRRGVHLRDRRKRNIGGVSS